MVGGAVIAVLNVAVLLTGDGSGSGLPAASFAAAVAVFVIAAVMFSITVTVALPPATIPPRLHWNCDPNSAHDPWLGVPDTNVPPAGTKSFTVTCGAKLGPRLLAVTT